VARRVCGRREARGPRPGPRHSLLHGERCHTGDEGLWFLSAGISLVGVGFFFSGWLTPFFGVEQALAVTLTSTVSAVGLILIVYSMFTDTHVRAGP